MNQKSFARIIAALGAASQFKGATAPWAGRILDAICGVLECTRIEALAIKSPDSAAIIAALVSMVSFGASRDEYRLDRAAAELKSQTATDFWLRAACQSAVFVLWNDAAREMLQSSGADALDEQHGSAGLIDRVTLDVALLDSLFGGLLKLDLAQDADFRPVSDLDRHLLQVANEVVRRGAEARERREARAAVTPKPPVAPPAPRKRGLLSRLIAAFKADV